LGSPVSGSIEPLLRRSYCCRVRADGLSNAGQTRVGLSQRDLVGLRVDAKESVTGLDLLIVGNQHLLDSSSNFGRHADNECLDRRLRCVGRHAVGDDGVKVKSDDHAKNDERPSSHRIARSLIVGSH
jgi:hypothetical protein